MSDHISAERVAAIATALELTIDAPTAARIAAGVSPTAKRFRAGNVAPAFETEPSTYITVAQEGIKQ
jgi:hypothetical protein